MQLFGTHQGRQRARNAVERALGAFVCPLDGLERLPPGRCLRFAENVRMARFHLVGDRPGDVCEGEVASFLGHTSVEDDLEQQIAEFAAQVVDVVALDRVGDLVGFLDRVRRYGREILRASPLATGGAAEAGHYREEAVELLGHLGMIIYIMLNNTRTKGRSSRHRPENGRRSQEDCPPDQRVSHGFPRVQLSRPQG